MSGIGQSEEGVASTSGMMETSMMEGEEYYNPGDTSTWTQKEMSEQLCRICSKPNQYLIPIFEGEGIEHQLESKIQKHLPIEVLETDELPLQVCYQCASTLIAWNDLVIACIEADKKLRQLFQHHEDQDDKGAEFFDEPILDSDEGEEPTHQSTSPATVISDSQTEILSTKRSPGKAKKSKLQTALLKSSTAGPSGHKPLSKKTVVSSQDDAVQEGTERNMCTTSSIETRNYLQAVNHTAQYQNVQLLSTSLPILQQPEIIYDTNYQPIQPKPLIKASSESSGNFITINLDNELQCFKQNDDNIFLVSSYKLEETNDGIESQANKLVSCTFSEDSSVRSTDQLGKFCCIVCCKLNISIEEITHHVQCGGSYSNAKALEECNTEPHSLSLEKSANAFYCIVCQKEGIADIDWANHIHQETSNRDVNQPLRVNHINTVLTGETVLYSCSFCKKDQLSVEDLLHHITQNCMSNEQIESSKGGLQTESESEVLSHPTIKYGESDDRRLLHINCFSKVVNGMKVVSYSCTVCNVDDMTITEMCNHISCMPMLNSDTFTCSQCGQTYKSKLLLKNHIITHNTKSDFFRCNFCEKDFRFKTLLKNHLLIEHDDVLKIFKCAICYESFPSLESLKQHEPHHGAFMVKGNLCSACGKNFTTRSNLRSHVIRMHDTKPKKHICEFCGRGFDHAVRLRLHLLKHTGTKDVICEICGNRFYQNSELYKHMTCHSQDRPFGCKLCDGRFKRRCNLMTHEAMMHGIVPKGHKAHKCPVCGKTFLIAKLLSDHMMTHSGEKFSCLKCGEEFIDKRSHTYHVKNNCQPPVRRRRPRPRKNTQPRRPTEGQSHQCKICGKIFKASSNLGQHVRKVHEKDNHDKFCCTICGKLFKWKICLDEHVRIHLNLKPCICKACGKPFRTWSSLARHKKVHQDIRAYQCQFCGKAFRQHGHLRVHMRIHTGIKPYPCGLCDMSFMYNNEKIKHQNKMHNMITHI